MATVQIAFYKGRVRLFNRLVAWWTRGPYSHCELIASYTADGTAVCWSASIADGGVRRKEIKLDPDHWDLLDVPAGNGALGGALAWFGNNAGSAYDVAGLLGFVWRASADNKLRWFCSEAVAAALGFGQAWRFSPNDLYAVLTRSVDDLAVQADLSPESAGSITR
jgi:hypothetical protein